MSTQEIPRLDIDVFAEAHFKVPFLPLEHYPLDAVHFIIKTREETPVQDYISANRRQFYKIFHMTAGTGILTVGLHQYELGPGALAFLHPDAIMSWQTTAAATGGHFCLIHPAYFGGALHVLDLFRQAPYFRPDRAVVQLAEEGSARVADCFRQMYREATSVNGDRKQAILLHLQLLFLEAQRAGTRMPDAPVPEMYRHTYGFLELLETAFRIEGPDTVVRLKTAAEFAEQLHVHPNYLNALVKAQTGKTLREHIQERLLYEAKTLLVQTGWDLRTIGTVLGFSGHAAFTAFFTKKERVSPSKFRADRLAAAVV